MRRGELRVSGGQGGWTLAKLTSPLNVARGKHPLVCSRTAEVDTDSTPSCNNARAWMLPSGPFGSPLAVGTYVRTPTNKLADKKFTVEKVQRMHVILVRILLQ